MRTMVFRENDNVLLVGEGNFSFASSLAKHNLNIAITATCYESCVSHDDARININFLRDRGIRVLLGVDATAIKAHAVLSDEQFDKIVFNFPHVGGKMRMDRNRELLRQFFVSAEESIKPDGSVLLTLCNGQGGTFKDEPTRRWDDTWKVREMAAHGNFILKHVQPFEGLDFPDYKSTGYRGLDKKFNVINALTHYFVRVKSPSGKDLASMIKPDSAEFKIDDKEYIDALIGDKKIIDSLCPPIFKFDITFSVFPDFSSLELYQVLYNFAGRIVRNVEFVRSYKFPDRDTVTQTYRILYQSDDIPLYRDRIVDIHRNVIAKILEDNMNVIVSR